MITFKFISTTDIERAFLWQKKFAQTNSYVFPRTIEDYRQFAEDQWLWGAVDEGGDYLGFVYYVMDSDTWEIGGLMVSEQARGCGIGSTLMRIALANTLLYEDPLLQGKRVIAHVHEENDMPRPIIENALRFKIARQIEVDGQNLPGLKTNDHGKVIGTEYELSIQESLNALADWCFRWNGFLKNEKQAEIELLEGVSLDDWASDLKQMRKKYSKNKS